MAILDSAGRPVWSGVGYFVQDKTTAEGRFEIVPAGVSGGFYGYINAARLYRWALLVRTRHRTEPAAHFELMYTHYIVSAYLAGYGYLTNDTCVISIEQFRRLVTDQKYRIFLFSGHHVEGYNNQIMLQTSIGPFSPGLSIAAAEVEYMPIGPNQYQLVVISACYQAQTDAWAQAFRIDPVGQANEEAFMGYDLSPRYPILCRNNAKLFEMLCMGMDVRFANSETVGALKPPYSSDGTDVPEKTWFPKAEIGEDYWHFYLKQSWQE